jgi:hypothetical protein
VLARFRYKVSWAVFEHRNRVAALIQRMVRRRQGLKRFLAWHDSQPLNGCLADMDMHPCRFLDVQVVPRVREAKRRFWRSARAIQTAWRRVIHVRWWQHLRRTAIFLQALARVPPARRVLRTLRRAVATMQKLVRMALKRWPYLRLGGNVRLLQRVVRGHLARVVSFKLLLARRAQFKVGGPTLPRSESCDK